MGLVIGLGGGNAGGGGVIASGLIQDMPGVTWTGSAQITDKTITEFPGADFRDCTSLQSLFQQCGKLVSVGELKNTGNVTSANNMFFFCVNLQSVPLFDTSKVTDMSNMFSYCQKLQTVHLLDTAKVTKTSFMFQNCYELQSVPDFDTGNVTNMSGMFRDCKLLQTVPLFDTAKVTDMSYLFCNCSNLQSVKAFDTANVTKMISMFFSCSALQSIGGINIIKVTSDSNADSMFYNCNSLVTANISNLCVSLDLSYCKVLSIDSVLYLFNNAQSGVSGKTIQLNSLVFDQLTEDQIAIATEKGFSVTSVVIS